MHLWSEADIYHTAKYHIFITLQTQPSNRRGKQ